MRRRRLLSAAKSILTRGVGVRKGRMKVVHLTALDKGWSESGEEKEMDISEARRSGTLLSSSMNMV